jgi:hypothetical protein
METMYLYIRSFLTDQIRDATAEAVSAAFAEPTDYVDFQNWQKLTLKEWPHRLCFRTGFENAQIIMESARDLLTRQV